MVFSRSPSPVHRAPTTPSFQFIVDTMASPSAFPLPAGPLDVVADVAASAGIARRQSHESIPAGPRERERDRH